MGNWWIAKNGSIILIFETNIHFWTNIPFQTISIQLETSDIPIASYSNLQLVVVVPSG